MKVKPRIKSKPLGPNEIRIITVGDSAIGELLSENLMANQSEYFKVPAISDDTICITNWDTQQNILTYAIMPIKYCFAGYGLDFSYIRKTYGLTTDSLFKANRYKSITLTDAMLIQRKTEQDS